MTMQTWKKIKNVSGALPVNTVVIWLVALPNFYRYLSVLRSWLQPPEQQKADRFHFEIHQQRYAISQGLLRFFLGHYLSTSPEKIIFSTHRYGKPFIENSTIHFNISHSNDYAIYAFAIDSEMGIDIEFWRERKYLDQIIDSNFSPIEQTIYHQLNPKLKIAGFYQGWTCNEAYIKAIGMGLSFPLQEFSVEMDPTKPAKLITTAKRADCKTDWVLHQLPVPKNYSAAIAVENNLIQLALFELDDVFNLRYG